MQAWRLAHEAREAQGKGRHGEPAGEQEKSKKKPGLAKEEEAALFHRELGEHKREEGALGKPKNWASS